MFIPKVRVSSFDVGQYPAEAVVDQVEQGLELGVSERGRLPS